MVGFYSKQSRKSLEDLGLRSRVSGLGSRVSGKAVVFPKLTGCQRERGLQLLGGGCALPGDRGRRQPRGSACRYEEVRARCGPTGSGQASPCRRGAPLSGPMRGRWHRLLPPGRLKETLRGVSVIGISASPRCRSASRRSNTGWSWENVVVGV